MNITKLLAMYIMSKKPAYLSQYAWAKKRGFKSQQHLQQMLKSKSHPKVLAEAFRLSMESGNGLKDLEEFMEANEQL